MSNYARVNVKFGADISEFSTAMQNAARDMQRAGDQLQAVGKSLTMNLTAPIVALGAAALYSYGEIDALKRGLTTFAGSAAAAETEFNKLREVAKLPGIGLEEAVRGSNNLQAIGLDADYAREAMQAFGNAIATVGGGRENFDLAIRGFGQLANASKPLQQDLYQIANQLPQVNKIMKDTFGTNRAEDLAKLGMSGKDLADFLVKELGKIPPMTGGIKNAFENMADSTKVALAGFGEAIDKNFDISGKLSAFAAWIGNVSDGFSNLQPWVQKIILGIAGLAAALGPVLLLFGGLLLVYPKWIAAMAVMKNTFKLLSASVSASILPFLAWVAGIAAVIAAGVYLYANWNVIAGKLKNLFIGLTTAILQRLQVLVKGIGKVFEFFGSSAFVGVEAMFDHLVTSLPEEKDAGKFKSFGDSLSETMADIKKAIFKEKLTPEIEVAKKNGATPTTPSGTETKTPFSYKVNKSDLSDMKANNKAVITEMTNLRKGIDDEESKRIESQLGWAAKSKSVLDAKAISDMSGLQKSLEVWRGWQEDWKQLLQQLNQATEQFIEGTLVNVAEKMGSALGGQKNPFEDWGKFLLESLGGFLQKLGGLFIAFGINLSLFKDSLKSMNPYLAIAAGVALVAIGAAISATSRKGLEGGGGGSGGSYKPSSQSGELTLTTRLDGRDLVLSGQRTTATTRR